MSSWIIKTVFGDNFSYSHKKLYYPYADIQEKCNDFYESLLMDDLTKKQALEKYKFLINYCAHVRSYDDVLKANVMRNKSSQI